MKKSVLYILILLFLLYSCTPKSVPDAPEPDPPNEECEEIDIFKEYFGDCFEVYFKDYYDEYFGDWDFQDVFKSETYYLLVALIEYIDKNQVRLVAYPPPDFTYSCITIFNERLQDSEEAISFFKREDCGFVLLSTYLDFLMTEKYLNIDSKFWGNTFFTFLKPVLFSNMCMEALNEKEKVQLMVLVLESIQRGIPVFHRRWAFTVVISIMKSSNYSPFANDVKPLFVEAASGLTYCFNIETRCSRRAMCAGDDPEASDWITCYARKFINDNNY